MDVAGCDVSGEGKKNTWPNRFHNFFWMVKQ